MAGRTEVVRDLILALADSKRLLGMRYAGWILGAPELETGIACASMAQDEWGHGRLLYSLLKDFDDDVDRLEHGREAAEYRNIEMLDRAPATWPDLVVANAFVDRTISVQLDALSESSWAPVRQRVGKMLDEERFHAAHGEAWFRRLARGGDVARTALTMAAEAALPIVLRWYGPDSDHDRQLVEDGVTNAPASGLRDRLIGHVGPLLDEIGLDAAGVTVDFDGFDEATRRCAPGGPDERTLAQVRGDRNRAFLMD
ncbi:MAG: 1,2-phenylacetyl-CoA epoxidase subunit PaaC [Longimicrobiales bacterium]